MAVATSMVVENQGHKRSSVRFSVPLTAERINNTSRTILAMTTLLY